MRNKLDIRHMSARQPFLPSRPASRTINTGDDVAVTSDNTGSANSSTASESNSQPELAVKYQLELPKRFVVGDKADLCRFRDPLAPSISRDSRNLCHGLEALASRWILQTLLKGTTVAVAYLSHVRLSKAPQQHAYMRLARSPHLL
jgi:hypothetical protein